MRMFTVEHASWMCTSFLCDETQTLCRFKTMPSLSQSQVAKAQLVTQNCFISSHRFHLTEPADNDKSVQPDKRTHGYHLTLHSTCTHYLLDRGKQLLRTERNGRSTDNMKLF